MPELPEVELAARRLIRELVGRPIAAVRVVDPKLLTGDPPGALEALRDRVVQRVERRGKYLLLGTGDGPLLLVHLRMTGRFVFAVEAPAEPVLPIRCIIHLVGGGVAMFRDLRRFGRFALLGPDAVANYAPLARLGPDALLDSPSAARLAALTRGRRQRIKALLMDQRRMAGLGNICAIEILYRAGIAPDRPAGQLTPAEVDRLAEVIPVYLRWAIERQSRREVIYLGERGAENVFTIYRRAGEPCERCGSRIVRTRVAGRGTYHCPGCQR